MKMPREMKKAIAKDILLSKKKEVKEKLENTKSVKEYCFYEIFKEAIDWAIETFEHEAIPVEWLLNHIPHDEPMERYNEKLIEYLVIGWRKENE